ncbi:MAG: hypothetical protein J0H17_14575 [Rhizobiales bacterium]|nr:hypothetical protein [Hyphomicrobiales bacterium]
MHPAAVAHQRHRLMRPDAARWFKPVGAPSAKCASSQPVMSAEEFERELESIRREYLELKAMLAVRKFERIWAAFCAKAYNPDQPRVPAGNPEGGQWTDEGDGSSGTPSAKPAKPLMRLAGEPPTGDPPKVPEKRPPTAPERNSVVKSVVRWLGRYGGTVGKIVKLDHWLYEYDQVIKASLDPPKSLQQLQDAVSTPEKGYEIHHIVEQTPAAHDGYPREMIDGRENLVRIPTLKHRDITAWYQTKNPRFDGLSPRDYLRSKSWTERRALGLEALIDFGVLDP